MADKKISELDLTLQINNDAVFPMSQENAGEPTTFKAAITQLGTKIAEDMTFSNLQTTSKTLVGAINELLSLGSPIIIGTTAPTSSQGADGNIYVQYTEGTGGADDEVDGIYVKIDGAWCEIETGGGGGTTDYEDLSNKPQVNSVELVGNKSLDDLGIMPASLSKTVSGSIAHITDGADNIPVKSLVSQIVAVESGNGQPKSPDNPYTISGFASGIITVTDNDQITNTYTFAFGQTVYGGHFDNKGNLVVTHSVVDLGDFNWLYFSSANKMIYGSFPQAKKPTSTTQKANILCEIFETISRAEAGYAPPYTKTGIGIDTSGNLFIQAPNSTWTDIPSAVAEITGYKLVYELATPITLAITSQDIPTLLGENNIFSNCGDVEVTYYTDNADEIVEVSKATASTPLHNYSTDEQVVGTWIDGSTVYEKTLVMPNAVTVTANGAWIGSGVLKPSGSNVVRAEIVNDYIVGVIGIYVSSTNELYLFNIPKTADITIPANTPITIRYTKTA